MSRVQLQHQLERVRVFSIIWTRSGLELCIHRSSIDNKTHSFHFERVLRLADNSVDKIGQLAHIIQSEYIVGELFPILNGVFKELLTLERSLITIEQENVRASLTVLAQVLYWHVYIGAIYSTFIAFVNKSSPATQNHTGMDTL